MSLINCEINLCLTWFDKFVLSNNVKAATLALRNTKPFDPLVTLSIQDNAKLLEQLTSTLKRTINSNKYKPKASKEAPNPYLEFLVKAKVSRGK